MSYIIINKLKCHKQEDTFGKDDCRLEIYADGSKNILKKRMGSGDEWNINKKYEYKKSLEIKLYEEDVDPDDHLGTIKIENISTINKTGKFTQHGASYTIYYDVSYQLDKPEPDPKPEPMDKNIGRKLTLMNVKCYKTEDITGGDELRLEVYADGAYVGKLNKDLNNNETWTLNKSYDYSKNVELKLWDEDTDVLGIIDPDDLLAHTVIDTNLTPSNTKRFKLSNSDYSITYKVEAAREITEPDIRQLILDFENSKVKGVWPNINKADLISDIRRIVSNPLNINQDSALLCGPAAVVYELVKASPKRYVQMCRSCYELGKISGRKVTYTASTNLRNSKVKNGVTPANWMILATLVDSSNLISSVDESDKGWASISPMNYLMDWTKDILLYDKVEYISTAAWGEFDAMTTVDRAYKNGGVAFLLINSVMLGNKKKSIIGVPNHWVSYAGGLKIDNGVWYKHDSGSISFNCYSWGDIKSLKLSEGKFESNFFGVVIGYK